MKNFAKFAGKYFIKQKRILNIGNHYLKGEKNEN